MCWKLYSRKVISDFQVNPIISSSFRSVENLKLLVLDRSSVLSVLPAKGETSTHTGKHALQMCSAVFSINLIRESACYPVNCSMEKRACLYCNAGFYYKDYFQNYFTHQYHRN